jgi:hypothetical protein
MMYIKGYLDHPPLEAPDPGEILYARRSADDKFTLAVVEKAWRNRAGLLRVRVVWLDDDPDASPGEKDRNDRDGRGLSQDAPTQHMRPVAAHEVGWLTLRDPLEESPLIRQIDRDSLPRIVVSAPDTESGDAD